MKRSELEHIIRAAAATVNVRDIVVIGSQAILGSFPEAPQELRESMEADVFPKNAPERSIVIDGAIGELSMFHDTFGYYAHGVDDTTAILPDGWRDRLVQVESEATMGAIGWCLDAHDLAISKLVAGRDKDLAFVASMLRLGLVNQETLRQRLESTSRLEPQLRDLVRQRIDGHRGN